MKRARVILADDHTMFVEGLEKLLKPEFKVVGSFSDGLSLVKAARELDPDVIVLDTGMSHMNGLTAGQQLKRMMPRVRLIYLTACENPGIALEAFRLGASGYLLKTATASELVLAIREAVRGGSYVTPLMAPDVVWSFIQNYEHMKEQPQLGLRQRQVLQLLAEGHSLKEIAFKLDISPRTAAFHKYSMMEQLRLSSNAELIKYAVTHYIVGV